MAAKEDAPSPSKGVGGPVLRERKEESKAGGDHGDGEPLAEILASLS